jgi:hypothetical protein
MSGARRELDESRSEARESLVSYVRKVRGEIPQQDQIGTSAKSRPSLSLFDA